MKRSLVSTLTLALLLLSPGVGFGSTQSELGEALRGHQPVFLVVTQGGARGTDRAVQIANQARELVPAARVVTLDRGLEANADLVKKYRVLGAPVPLILVLANNGIVAGGALLKDATPKVIANLVPTPKKTDMLGALEAKRAVFVVFSHATMERRGEVLERCSQAFTRLEPTPTKAQVISVDMGDKAEMKFMAEMGVDPLATEPLVVVLNAKGQKTAAFRQGMTVDQLVQAATKKAECCPGGGC